MTWTESDENGLIMLGWIFVLYMLRKHKPFDTIWAIFKVLIFIILIITTAGLALNWLKKMF